MGYEWPAWALDALRGSNRTRYCKRSAPHGGGRGWPPARVGLEVLTVWARTRPGRPLIVAVRQIGDWDWQIIGALDMREAELVDFEQREARRDD